MGPLGARPELGQGDRGRAARERAYEMGPLLRKEFDEITPLPLFKILLKSSPLLFDFTGARVTTENIPFTTFHGRLRQIDAATLPNTFDLFFPQFRMEEEWRSMWPEIQISVGSQRTDFIGRGRERRFAGDKSLSRGRYYCMVEPPANLAKNNTLLGELFAYAGPALPVQLELLDSTVDVLEAAQLARQYDWNLSSPCVIHIIRGIENPWIFSPSLGIGPNGLLIRYAVNVVEKKIEKVIDLRLPTTLDWLMRTFGRLEAETEFIIDASGETLHTNKGSSPPSNLASFLPLILLSS